jgi:RimJ/RimL family protein N-acetyltransferase
MLDDPSAPTIYRTSGSPPFPDPKDPNPPLPAGIAPIQVTLRDRLTTATIVPFSSMHSIPPSLLAYLSGQLNSEIEKGDTYPMMEPWPTEKFGPYWFQNFGAVMLLGSISAEDVQEGKDWSKECLGSFYIKPNYPGRSSHVCNAGFLVTDAARNRGVGRLMGETYLTWAPLLGYTYSVFNLVYETNVASCRIWDALGFKRIGRVKGCGNLKSYPGQYIDAIIYGRDLGSEGEDSVSEERFDKIKFYLKTGKYPNGADRAEKSRLRSAATHYKLVDEDKLMLKDKEVVSDPLRQYEIARQVHGSGHGGINKTTALIAEKYHWVRIKETVSLVIKNCVDCKDVGKAPVKSDAGRTSPRAGVSPSAANTAGTTSSSQDGNLNPHITPQRPFDPSSVAPHHLTSPLSQPHGHTDPMLTESPNDLHAQLPHTYATPTSSFAAPPPSDSHLSSMRLSPMHIQQLPGLQGYTLPLDPQIMDFHGTFPAMADHAMGGSDGRAQDDMNDQTMGQDLAAHAMLAPIQPTDYALMDPGPMHDPALTADPPHTPDVHVQTRHAPRIPAHAGHVDVAEAEGDEALDMLIDSGGMGETDL